MVKKGVSLKSRIERPTASIPDDDPYLWLEQIEGERTLGFVEWQNRMTLDKFGGPAFEPDRDTLAAIYDRPDNIPYVSRCGGLLSNLWKDAGNPRGLWRRTTMDEFRKGEPARETLLDIDELARREDADWLLNWSSSRPGAAQVILGLARGGSDTVSLREFDRNTKSFMPNGLVVGKPRAAQPGSSRYRAVVQRLWRGHGDKFGLCADGAAVATRRADRMRTRGVRNDAPSHERLLPRRLHR